MTQSDAAYNFGSPTRGAGKWVGVHRICSERCGAVRLGCLRLGRVVAHAGILLFHTCPELELGNSKQHQEANKVDSRAQPKQVMRPTCPEVNLGIPKPTSGHQEFHDKKKTHLRVQNPSSEFIKEPLGE